MVAIYCDGADLATMAKYAQDTLIEGFTTNPSLMRKSGVTNYREFAKQVLGVVNGKPVSFEVLSDDWGEMESQAREIASWDENVWVKIPVTNTKGESSIYLIDSLSSLNLNITAVMTTEQMHELKSVIQSWHIVSVFAGRIKDANGPVPEIPVGFRARCLWASTRQTYDLTLAEVMGFQLITMTPDLIAKLPLRGKDLKQYSLETVQQFHKDGKGITF
jgi:transaldolase